MDKEKLLMTIRELDEIRTKMFKEYCRVTRIPEDQERVEVFMELQDQHQVRLARMAKMIEGKEEGR